MLKHLILAAFCCFATASMAQENQALFGGQQVASSTEHYAQKLSDLNYAGDGQVYHNLDVYLPKNRRKAYPVVIHIYGSAWYSNNSKGMADINTICASLLDAGYAVVTPNHRSSSDAKFPAQLHDIKAVVRYLRAHAKELQLDTRFIAISGFSSGGHLASLMGMTNGIPAYSQGAFNMDLEGTVGGNTEQSSKVDAVVSWSGPIDLLNMDCAGARNMPNTPEEAVVGLPVKGNEDAYRLLSATTYANRRSAPVIIFHGTADNVVPFCQSAIFDDVLTQRGVEHEYVPVEGGGHGFNMYTPENLSRMICFIQRHNKIK